MRRFLIFLWLLIPLGVAAYHLGPGQDRMDVDQAAAHVSRAQKLVAQAENLNVEEEEERMTALFEQAIEHYDKALASLPEEEIQLARELRLNRAKAKMFTTSLPEARSELENLQDELAKAGDADPKVVDETRAALAGSQYYMTWLMQLEGFAEEEWMPEIEASRQNYRLLAEGAEKSGDAIAAGGFREDLEAAVKLARMDLSELQGMPLPCQCCCNCSGKKPGRAGKKKKKGKGQLPKDSRGAGDVPPPDGQGS